ncbi:MAG: DUF4388 domain-containing protein [Polyangiaceae bacterium]
MWSPTWVGERLHAEALINERQLRSALSAMQHYGERIEEALLRTGAIDEHRLLSFVAERCRTHFVSTAKLARIEVPTEALSYVSERTADKLLVFPVRWEAPSETLSVVSPDAGDPEYVKQLRISTGVRNLKAYVARPAAVKAAIAKWYRGEIQAFAEIAADTFTQIHNTQDRYERGMLDSDARPARRGTTEPRVSQQEYFLTPVPVAPAPPAQPPPPMRSAKRTDPFAGGHAHRISGQAPAPLPPAPPPPAAPPPAASVEVNSLLNLDPPDVADPESSRPLSAPRASPGRISSPRILSPHSEPPPSIVERRVRDLAELLNVLVSLAENTRDEFRGHSSSVARLSRMTMQRMGLDETAAAHAGMAANLHDLGKPVSYHLTALNVAQYTPHRTAAQKLVYTPGRLVESVGLPMEATSAVAAMYERFDGQGFPGRLQGKNIPLGGRVLALCDTYSDLTLNPRNPYRKELSHEEAHDVMIKFAGTIFDPDLVELLTQLVVGEDLRRKLTDDKPLVLVVEPDPEEATILELRLVAQGFEVKVARAADQALRIAEHGDVRYVLSETELAPFDGFELLARLKRSDAGRDIPFMFVARQSDAAAVDRGFALGAQDYVVKPTSGDVLAGKLRRLAHAAPRADISSGVAGSLSDMALPDLVQILHHGRKSGRLRVRSGPDEGEVHFQDGRIVHAICQDKRSEEAFYELLTFAEGSFALEPGFKPSEDTITTSPDMLVLEGLRRLDERNR